MKNSKITFRNYEEDKYEPFIVTVIGYVRDFRDYDRFLYLMVQDPNYPYKKEKNLRPGVMTFVVDKNDEDTIDSIEKLEGGELHKNYIFELELSGNVRELHYKVHKIYKCE